MRSGRDDGDLRLIVRVGAESLAIIKALSEFEGREAYVDCMHDTENGGQGKRRGRDIEIGVKEPEMGIPSNRDGLECVLPKERLETNELRGGYTRRCESSRTRGCRPATVMIVQQDMQPSSVGFAVFFQASFE